MGGPVEKGSGRTFNPVSTSIPDACRTSLSVTSFHTLEISNRPPSEALKSGLPMSVSATIDSTLSLQAVDIVQVF